MEQKTDFLSALCADEAVCFIAARHNVTPRQLLRSLHIGEPPAADALPAGADIALEANEIEILRGLCCAVTD